MLYDKLAEYFGDGDREQEQYVRAAERKMSELQQNKAYGELIQRQAKRFGFPDISLLSKYLQTEKKSGGTYEYYWSVCNDCGAEFDYRFSRCPKCHLAGKTSSGYRVRGSATPPGQEVIRWNLMHMEPEEGEKVCVNCEHRDSGYCRWFGNPEHQCPESDYRICECKQCCANYKKANRNVNSK